MEEEAPSRRSVAELAGRFKSSAPPHSAAGNETEKPVRRRPPRSLQLPKTHGDDQEQPPDVTSPLSGKPKRNSALIEKLQANLALSPTALLPSPKSPGLRLLSPAFIPPSPSSASETTVTTSSTATPTSPVTEQEGPTSFEAPPTAAEGSILTNINKGRARHSIRRRPPSRRHRRHSSGDEVGVANEGADTPLSSPSEPDKTAEEGGEDKKKGEGGGEEEEDKTECPEEDDLPKEDPLKNGVELRGEEEKKKEEEEEEDGEKVKTEEEDQEKSSGGKQEEDQTSADGKEEKSEETTCQSSAR